MKLTQPETVLAHTGVMALLKSGKLDDAQRKAARSMLKKLHAEYERLRCMWCTERPASRPGHLCHRCHRYKEVNGILPPEYVLIGSGVKKTRMAKS